MRNIKAIESLWKERTHLREREHGEERENIENERVKDTQSYSRKRKMKLRKAKKEKQMQERSSKLDFFKKNIRQLNLKILQ